jgi:hypothetical protein
MTALSQLQDIAQALMHDSSAARVKKLTYYACRRVWEGDLERLERLDMNWLLEELLRQNPTLEQLMASLTEVIQHINKKAEYAQVAKTVLNAVIPLYSQSPSSPSPEDADGTLFDDAASPQAWAHIQKADYNPYDLRADLMRQTNGLRAKLVLHTALYHPLELNEKGLSVLKQTTLDSLVAQLLETCDTPEQLEAKLRDTLNQLPERDHHSQTVGTLLQLLKPLYVYLEPERPQVPESVGGLSAEAAFAGVVEDLSWLDAAAFGDAEQYDRITQGDRLLPLESESYYAPDPYLQPEPVEYEADPQPASAPRGRENSAPVPATAQWDRTEEISRKAYKVKLGRWLQQLVDKNASTLMITLENTLNELGNQLDESLQDEDPESYLHLKHQVLRAFLMDVEGSSATFLPILHKLEESERRLLHPEQQMPVFIEEARQVEDPYSALRQILGNSGLVQSKPALEQEILRMVKRSMSAVKTGIENKLSEFGNELDETVLDLSLGDGLTLKYQALRALISEVEEISSKFASLLAKMEEAERRLFGLD